MAVPEGAFLYDTYNPTEADYVSQRLITAQGFEITREDANHLAVFARGKIDLIQQK